MYTDLKRQLLLGLSTLFEHGKQYSQAEVDALIVQSVMPAVLEEPNLSLDHLRVGLYVLGLLSRSHNGEKYWLSRALEVNEPDSKEVRKAIKMCQKRKVFVSWVKLGKPPQ